MTSRFLRHLASERGTTLIEAIVTIAIMGLAFSAILGGVAASIVLSDVHRKQASSQTILRSYADAVEQTQSWAPCATVDPSGVGGTYDPATIGFVIPAIYGSTYKASATQVQYWNGTRFLPGCPAPGADKGLQQVSLKVQSTDTKATETLDVLRRCLGLRSSAGGPCP